MDYLQLFMHTAIKVPDNCSKDYREFAELLANIDRILVCTGAEDRLIHLAVAKMRKRKTISKTWQSRFVDYASFEIRSNLLRRLLNLDYRAFSIHASDSAAVQWFINRGRIGGFTGELSGLGLSKSSLERYDKIIGAEALENEIRTICAAVAAEGWTEKIPGWKESVNIRDIWVDCTCLECDIHFPVDWVLLRDAVRTLVSCIECIRRHGLRHRIREPRLFLSEINKHCIEMSAVSRAKKNAKRKRKRVLRKMKAVVELVRTHAERYRTLLLSERQARTDLTGAEAAQIIGRIDEVLMRLPAAIKQAEDRIIRERKVEDSEKVLSFYEPNVHAIFRGKSGSLVEFGNTLYLAENRDGLIVDFMLYRNRAPADCKMIKDSLIRCEKAYGSMDSITSDRGFHSPDNTTLLSEHQVVNNILPKSPREMHQAFEDPSFREAQKRRAQTEGRIGILKNVFIGDRLAAKGFEHQRLEVAWCIMVHNLWVLARMTTAVKRVASNRDTLGNTA